MTTADKHTGFLSGALVALALREGEPRVQLQRVFVLNGKLDRYFGISSCDGLGVELFCHTVKVISPPFLGN